MTEYIPIFVPAILGFATSGFCRIGKSAGSAVPFRPPAWVFGFAWVILYTLFGFSWFFANKETRKRHVVQIATKRKEYRSSEK